MPTARFLLVAVINAFAWLALVLLPGWLGTSVPILLFAIGGFVLKPSELNARISPKELFLTIAFLAALFVIGYALEQFFGKSELTTFVHSWLFAAFGWSTSMLILFWPWLRRLRRRHAG